MGTRTFRGTQTRTHARRSSTTNTKAAESSASSATGASIMTERVRTSELAAKPIRSRKAEAAQPAEEQQKQQPSSTHLVTPSTPTCPFLQPLSRTHTLTRAPPPAPPGPPDQELPSTRPAPSSQASELPVPSTQHPSTSALHRLGVPGLPRLASLSSIFRSLPPAAWAGGTRTLHRVINGLNHRVRRPVQ